MQTTHLPEGDVLDILFAHRNKEYGAYALRRAYPERLWKGVLISLFLSGVAALLLWRSAGSVPLQPSPLAALPVEISEVFIPPPPKAELPPSPPQQGSFVRAIQDIVPLVVPDHTPIEHPVPTIEERSESVLAVEARPGETGEGNASPGTATGPSPDLADAVEHTPPLVYDFTAVEIPAQFPGGARALKRFLERHLRVPEPADGDVAGQVKVLARFVVEADGRTGRVELLAAGGEDYDREVLRVLAMMPRWTPARQNQREVAMYFILPIVFDRITDQ
jgi:protein TonB